MDTFDINQTEKEVTTLDKIQLLYVAMILIAFVWPAEWRSSVGSSIYTSVISYEYFPLKIIKSTYLNFDL